jgi:hypothetical protein
MSRAIQEVAAVGIEEWFFLPERKKRTKTDRVVDFLYAFDIYMQARH